MHCLLVTTRRDISLSLLTKSLPNVQTSVIFYGNKVPAGPWDLIYLRDPFNEPNFDEVKIKGTLRQINKLKGTAYMVDGVSSYKDLLAEDKWKQYRLFGKLMPKTTLLSRRLPPLSLIKKRISSRSRGIYFRLDKLSPGYEKKDYIVQQKLQIQTEYRVYMIGPRLISPLAIKRSKTPTKKAKLIGLVEEIPAGVKQIGKQVYKRLGYDFAGLDIADAGGSYKLLEVNRSPQFDAFAHLGGPNLTEELLSYLASKTIEK